MFVRQLGPNMSPLISSWAEHNTSDRLITKTVLLDIMEQLAHYPQARLPRH